MQTFLKSLSIIILLFSSVHASAAQIKNVNPFESSFSIGETEIIVDIRDKELRQKKQLLLEWVVQSAQIVEQYYGRFPVQSLSIDLEVTGGSLVKFGQAFGGNNPYIRVVVGENVDYSALQEDWIMVHEMVHLAMGNVPRQHRWWLEGLATYVESVARAQTGYLNEDFVWNGFIMRMPLGLPASND